MPCLQISFTLDLFLPPLCSYFQLQPIPCPGLQDLSSCQVRQVPAHPVTMFLAFGQSVQTSASD